MKVSCSEKHSQMRPVNVSYLCYQSRLRQNSLSCLLLWYVSPTANQTGQSWPFGHSRTLTCKQPSFVICCGWFLLITVIWSINSKVFMPNYFSLIIFKLEDDTDVLKYALTATGHVMSILIQVLCLVTTAHFLCRVIQYRVAEYYNDKPWLSRKMVHEYSLYVLVINFN